MPITWCLATPKLGEREVAEALLDDAARQAALAAGTIILADKGFCGRAFQAYVRGLGAGMVRPDRSDEPVRFGSVGGVRQWIEAIIWTLKDQLGLERHRGRTLAGGVRPRGSAAVGLGRCGLVQLAAGRSGQAFTHRL